MSTRDAIPVVAPVPRVIYESRSVTPADVVETVASLATAYARATSNGVCVVDGIGIRLFVRSGALFVEDGVGEHRRTRRFDKATHGLFRVVVMAATGSWTLDALHWCRRLGIGVVVLAPDGTAVLESSPRLTDDARLRRIQAMAPALPVGLGLARELVARKLGGQASLLARRFGDVEGSEVVSELADLVMEVSSIDEARQVEAEGASIYWQSWTGRPECVPHFATRDRSRVPLHWTRYEGRRSVLRSANANRKAERPTNALLSYGYALLEAEAIFACKAVGLDAGLGLIHNDSRTRQSLALDLMEPVRPIVDAHVLDLLERRTFCKAEFVETSDGHCRLRAPLTHELAESLPRWSQAIAPIAERVAHALGEAMAGKYRPVTPLTRHRTRSAQAQVKARKALAKGVASSEVAHQRPSSSGSEQAWSCPDCGSPVPNHRHVRCETCIARDPRQAPEVRGRRGAAIASRRRAQQEWEGSNPGIAYDPDLFRREILPGLQRVKLAEIVAATGISKAYASDVRRGRYVPHMSTWAALADIGRKPVGSGQ